MNNDKIILAGIFFLMIAIIYHMPNHTPPDKCLTGPALDAHIAEVMQESAAP